MSIVNHNAAASQSSKSAELVAKYSDSVLKGTGTALHATDVDVAISKAVRMIHRIRGMSG